MHMVCPLLCFVVSYFRSILIIFFRITSLAVGQSRSHYQNHPETVFWMGLVNLVHRFCICLLNIMNPFIHNQWPYLIMILVCRDNSGYGLIQWETLFHRNAASHWLGPNPERSMVWYPPVHPLEHQLGLVELLIVILIRKARSHCATSFHIPSYAGGVT